jgi:hypothetical protein
LAALVNVDMLDADVLPSAIPQASENVYLHCIGFQEPRRSRSERRDPPLASTTTA